MNKPLTKLTADDLRRPVGSANILDELIIQEVTNVKDKIRQAYSESKNKIITAIPYKFNVAIQGMELDDIQLYIYHGIISSLEKDKFNVQIRMRRGETILKVWWDCDYNIKAKDKMLEFLEARSF